jgi:hypothetical protein
MDIRSECCLPPGSSPKTRKIEREKQKPPGDQRHKSHYNRRRDNAPRTPFPEMAKGETVIDKILPYQ